MKYRPVPTTIYLDPDLKRRLQHQAIEDGTSLSCLVGSYLEKAVQEVTDEQTGIKRKSRDPELTNLLEELGGPVPEDLYF